MPNTSSAQLFTRDSDTADWSPAKFSELMLEFAEPLLQAEPGGPANMDEFRNIMKFATLCWNAPMLEVRGDASMMEMLHPVLRVAPEPVASALRSMLSARLTRYAGVPHTIIAEIAGSNLENARCVARAIAAEDDAKRPVVRGPIAQTPIAFLSERFPELAEREQQVWVVDESNSAQDLPKGTYVLRERYCADPNCDCRRVMLYVEHVEGKRVVATIGYGFESPKAPYDRFERQIELDWLNPQSEHSSAALSRFEQQIQSDDGYRAKLMQHYRTWKAALAKNPQRAQTAGRKAKIGANASCPCGSGLKYKRCCRR